VSFRYIRSRYGVPAFKNARVRYTGGEEARFGTIIASSRLKYVVIRMDGDKNARRYHPTWEIEYIDTKGT